MTDKLGDILADVSLQQVEMMSRFDTALRALAAVILPDPRYAAAGIFGASLEMLIEHAGVNEAEVHAHVKRWFESHGEIRARLARLSIHAVPPPPANDDDAT